MIRVGFILAPDDKWETRVLTPCERFPCCSFTARVQLEGFGVSFVAISITRLMSLIFYDSQANDLSKEIFVFKTVYSRRFLLYSILTPNEISVTKMDPSLPPALVNGQRNSLAQENGIINDRGRRGNGEKIYSRPRAARWFLSFVFF